MLKNSVIQIWSHLCERQQINGPEENNIIIQLLIMQKKTNISTHYVCKVSHFNSGHIYLFSYRAESSGSSIFFRVLKYAYTHSRRCMHITYKAHKLICRLVLFCCISYANLIALLTLFSLNDFLSTSVNTETSLITISLL